MTKTMTNDEMAQALDTLAAVHESGRLGYAIARNTQALRKAAAPYLQLRADLFTTYGTVKGTTATVTGAENVKAFRDAIGDTPNETTEVEIHTVTEEIFIGGGLTNDQMEALFFMVEG